MDHLRSVGLLPPLPLISLLDENDDIDNKDIKCDNVVELDEATHRHDIRLLRDAHISYLSNALSNPLSKGFVSLDASHPWMVYWCLHSLDLLGYFDDNEYDENDGSYCITEEWTHDVEIIQKRTLLQRIVSTLQHCYMDVPLEFDHEEVIADSRLRELLLRDGTHDVDHNNTDASTGEDSNYYYSSRHMPERSAEKRVLVRIMGGGFGGGPQQLPHVATTYAAVLALSIVAALGMASSPSKDDHPYHEPGRLAMELLTKIRLRLYAFFLSLREEFDADTTANHTTNSEQTTTAFRMQHDGEIDVRASYCILAPCYLLGLLNNKACEDEDAEMDANASTANDNNPLLSPSVPRYIASCQTFEGGFGAEPFNEAHGGYTFCALAALRILNAIPLIDVNALSSWLARRQMSYEGGFCGRTNKLVDGCYSFWQGGAVSVLDSWLLDNTEGKRSRDVTSTSEQHHGTVSFDEVMLQRYVLLCAQDVNGGLRDKPSKPKDFYHSCYNLSGLSVSQHALKPWPAPSSIGVCVTGKEENFNNLFGDTKTNILGRTDPVINIREERVQFMLDRHQ